MIAEHVELVVAHDRLAALRSEIDADDQAHVAMLPSRVNYFGHAAVASWSELGEPSPGRSLGAMLPDFATMCGARLAEPTDPAIAAGIALHHRTDSVFHQAAPVLASMRELDARLDALGCARGPRRAVAHIGMELLLDATLLATGAYRDSFVSAFSVDPMLVAWREPDGPSRFARLHERMTTYGVPDDLADIDSIAARLHRMLAHRPLLAPSPSDLRAISAALHAHRPRIEIAAPTVLRAVRAALTQGR
jgi:acyl carrier protein phosphodiesterase